MNKSLVNSLKSAILIVAGLLGLLQIQQAHAWGQDLGGNVYNGNEVRRYQPVRIARIEDIREVVVQRESQQAGYVGAAIGGVTGCALGSAMGEGRGRIIMSAVGCTVGGSAGKVAGDQFGRETRHAAEIVLTLKTGETMAIVQELDQETVQLRRGDVVRLIEGQSIRVVKMNSY